MLWVQYNNAGNTLILWLLLSSDYPKSRVFQFPHALAARRCTRSSREHGQDSRAKLAKGIFHAMEHHGRALTGEVVQELLTAHQGQAGHWSV